MGNFLQKKSPSFKQCHCVKNVVSFRGCVAAVGIRFSRGLRIATAFASHKASQ